MALSLAKRPYGSVKYGRDVLTNSNHLSASFSGGHSGGLLRALQAALWAVGWRHSLGNALARADQTPSGRRSATTSKVDKIIYKVNNIRK
jgi:hypothetical protein